MYDRVVFLDYFKGEATLLHSCSEHVRHRGVGDGQDTFSGLGVDVCCCRCTHLDVHIKHATQCSAMAVGSFSIALEVVTQATAAMSALRLNMFTEVSLSHTL